MINESSNKFFNKKTRVMHFANMYKKINFSKEYPANKIRLDIFISLINKHKPKKIIDAGCGAGIPLIEIKKLGFNISGYDNAKKMVSEGKKNLINNNFNPELINEGNFNNPKHIKNNSVDCILGMGTFYYSKNLIKTLLNQRKKLKNKGRIIFSLRNKLFDISTMNHYSINFFSDLYKIYHQNKNIQKKFNSLFSGYAKRNKFIKKNIDTQKIFTTSHNPLNIQQELLDKVNLKLNGIYFYHFHMLPPLFESIFPEKFRKESWKIENPNDWKGFFMASGFIVDCLKD